MKPEDGVTDLTEADPYATRAPSPDSIEARADPNGSVHVEPSRTIGVGRAEFDRGLIEGGFLRADRLDSIVEDLSSRGQPLDSESLARHLVHLGTLTRYQASALFQGKGRSLQIGPYVVLDKLGSGGMGMVFKARLRKGGPEIALKLLPPSASRHPKAVLRFRREAEIMAKLNHPNLVSSHEIGQYGGVHYLVMDYVEGRDLDRVVRSGGPMKLLRALDCIIQAARGLAAAHQRGIVHRDIKPANLLLDTRGTVRVLDLGLARITQADESVKDAASAPSLTASGIIMGTVDYLPPEQSDDSKRADHRADIYALGCTLYFLLNGKPPFSGDSIMQRLLAHHKNPIPALTDARPEVPAEVEAIYRRMMAKTPEDRPQTIAEVADALEACKSRGGSGKGLRSHDHVRLSKAATPDPGSKTDPIGRKSAEESEPYDLLSFVRDELLAPEPPRAQQDPPLVLARKSRKSRSGRSPLDLFVKGLVGAAALAVLARLLPHDLFRSSTRPIPVKAAPAIVAEPPPRADPIPQPPTDPKIDTVKASKVVEPATEPPAGPSLLEELMKPPPNQGPPPPNPAPPRDGSAARKKGLGPPRGSGSF